MSGRTHLQIILGTTRQGRFSPTVGAWVARRATERGDVTAEIVDLRDFALPHYDDSGIPAAGHVPAAATAWVTTLERGDGYVFVTPEYNHGVPAVLKNAFDHAFAPWRRKPAAYVGFGSVGAARGIEQLRLVNLTVGMAALGAAVHITNHREAFDADGNMTNPSHDAACDRMLGELEWWARSLKAARAAG